MLAALYQWVGWLQANRLTSALAVPEILAIIHVLATVTAGFVCWNAIQSSRQNRRPGHTVVDELQRAAILLVAATGVLGLSAVLAALPQGHWALTVSAAAVIGATPLLVAGVISLPG